MKSSSSGGSAPPELLREELDELDELGSPLLGGGFTAGTNAGLSGKLESGNRLLASTMSAPTAPSCVKKVLKKSAPSGSLLLVYPCHVRKSPTL